MFEDDIQYLGSRSIVRTPPHRPFLNEQRALTGLVLHVEKTENESGYQLMFRKANGNVVNIGRSPPSVITPDRRQKDSESGRAMFRCQVVSRTHAKITFSDSGAAWITDLKSHHGTHIKKPEDIVSVPIMPEVATRLAQGDIITFGKSVGKGDTLVRPIVARVELLYGSQSNDIDQFIKPLVVPDSPRSPLSRSSSGRYGVHIASSSSSEAEGSNPVSDASDVEEIPSPVPVKPTVSSLLHNNDPFKHFKKFLTSTSRPSSPQYDNHSPSPQPPSDIVGASQSPMITPLDESFEGGYGQQESELDPSLFPPAPGAWPTSRLVSEEPRVIVAKETDASVEERELQQIKASLETIKDEIAKLHLARRRTKARLILLSDLEEKYGSLTDQMDNAVHFDIPELQAQIDTLQDQRERDEEEERDRMEEAERLMDELREIVQEMKDLRATTEAGMNIDMEAVSAARLNVLRVIAEAEMQVQESSSAYLKRKRPVEEEEVGLEEEGEEKAAVTEPLPVAVPASPVTPPAVAPQIPASPPPRKRARTIAIAQTVGAVTVGAVAAWSALAFY